MWRRPAEADAEAAFQWLGDPEVARYMRYARYEMVEQVRKWLRSLQKHEECHEFAFVRKADGLLIGSGGGSLDEAGEEWTVGYNLRRDCWGQGYATEALGAMLDYARRELGVDVVSANHAVENPASGRVMEKCGMTFCGRGTVFKKDGSGEMSVKYYCLKLK